MNALLGILTAIVFVAVLLVVPAHSDAAGALTVCVLLAIPIAVLLWRNKVEGQFLLQVFVAALLVRVLVGAVINVFELQEFFGGDAITYDFYGFALVKSWGGDHYYQTNVNAFFGEYGQSAWGMVYMVGALYSLVGRNMLAIQFTNAVFGADPALVVIGIGFGLNYMGVIQRAQHQAGYFGDLRVVERSRQDQSRAQAGFGQDVDVSTTEGAIKAVPLGTINLLFAPFPWEVRSLRQSITLPEMLVWWSCFPLLILGLWFTIRHRLRQSFVILIFTTMLTLAYSIYQGNVGTAYRQRSQLLVFYFIFVAVGYVLVREKREEKKQHVDTVRQHPEERPRERRLPISAGSPAKAS